MNNLNNLLKILKNNYNTISIRIDLAAEVYCQKDIEALCELAKNNNLSVTIKIGGCDSSSQIFEAKKYNAESIISPMIETPYSLKKFVNNCRKIFSDNEINNVNLYPNIETITSYNNINEILSVPEIKYIKGIVLGRDDMAASMELSEINSDKMLEIAKNLSYTANEHNIDFIIGGAIRPNAVEFLKKIPKIKRYETRMIVFDGNFISSEGITKAIEFEIEWLKTKQIKNDFDFDRIDKLKNDISSYILKS